MHIILRPAAQFVALAGMKQAQLDSWVDDVDNCKCGVAPGAGSGLGLIRFGPSCNRHPLAPLDLHNHDAYTLKMSPNIINIINRNRSALCSNRETSDRLNLSSRIFVVTPL